MLRGLYCKPEMLDCLAEWAEIATAANCSGSELACRWVKYNSALSPEYGDAIIFSSSTLTQTDEMLKSLERRPLDDDVVRGINGIWENVKNVAPLDNINA